MIHIKNSKRQNCKCENCSNLSSGTICRSELSYADPIYFTDSSDSVIRLLYKLRSYKDQYINDRFTFIPSEDMIEFAKYFGATEIDLSKLKSSGEYLADDPTLAFRTSRNGRYLLNFTEGYIQRLEFQPFVLGVEEDFVREDSGELRNFRGIQDRLQLNTAYQALMKIKSFIVRDVEVRKRPNLVEVSDQMVSTVFQLRTHTSKELLGEPAKEGVHSDGVDHTMTTFLKSENMSADSAISKLHSNQEVNGIPWDQIDENLVIGEYQHTSFLDTLFIVDSELKHSLSPVWQRDKDKLAIRDMLIFFTRRPKSSNHSSYRYDSLKPHREIPLKFNMR